MTRTAQYTLGDLTVPIRQRATAVTVPDGYYLARSLLKYTDRNGQPSHIPGFSFGTDRERCLRVSGFEALERLAATYDFQRLVLGRQERVPGNDWLTGERLTVPLEAVLIENNSPDDLRVDNDATGLAYHRDRSEAVEHAICEVVERSLFAEVWWRDAGLLEVGEPESLGGGFTFRTFCLDDDPIPPFVFGTAYNETERVWVCGSALDPNPADAVEHAKEECCMLLDNFFSGNETLAYQSDPEKERRLQTIQSGLSSERHDHVMDKRSGSASEFPQISTVDAIVDAYCSGETIRIATLWEDESHCVVRALCDGLLDVNEVRERDRDAAPPDIFL
jgi:hypothetical protein